MVTSMVTSSHDRMVKVLGFSDEASELYREAFCRLIQSDAARILERLESTRALAGVAQVRSTLSDSLEDSEVTRKKYVSAVSDLLNTGYSKVQGILSYGLDDDVDISIALTVNDKIVRSKSDLV